MSVSKKDFEAIALILKRLGDGYSDGSGMGEMIEKDDLIQALVEYFQSENPNFNPNTFIVACGIDVNASESWI
tara:strand:+ start:376 stop:594 length:219 start_codon:yes stop_codon:yes gene_type:complete